MPSHNTGLGLADILQATSSTAPNMLQRLGATLQGKDDPLAEHENRDLIRKIRLAQVIQEQQKIGLEQRGAALKDIESFNSILKVSKDFLQFIPSAERDKFAQMLSEKATNLNHPIRDPAIIRSYLEKPEEGIPAFDALIEGFKTGKVGEGFGNALKLTRDPELRKSLLTGLFKVMDDKIKGKTLSDWKSIAIEHYATDLKTGQIDPSKVREAIKDLETTPQGFESRTFDAFVTEEKNRPLSMLQSGESSSPEIRAYQRMLGAIGAVAGARGGGAIMGQAGAKAQPQVQAAETGFARAKRTGSEQGEAIAALTDLAQASGMVDEIDALSKQLITAKTDIESVKQRLKFSGQAFAFHGSLPRVYETRKKNLGEALQRNIGGLRGTATEGDIERAMDGLPGFGDTIKSRNYRIAAVRAIVATAIDNKRRLIQGEPIDLEKSRQQFKEMVDTLLSEKPTKRFKEIK